MTFIDYESLGLYIPDLDSRDEEQLFQEARVVTFNESKGVLRDFSEHSPLAALLRGFVFSGSEIQYRNKQILPALVLTYLEKLGGKRSLGSKAKALMRVRITRTFNNVYTIDKGTEITTQNGKIRFFTIEKLEIPPGLVEGFVEAESEFPGEEYNVGQFELSYITKPLAFLGSITNPERASDGTNPKTIEESIDETITANRVQTLASLPSYEDAITNILGGRSRAIAIYGINATLDGFEKGLVHVFGINAQRQPLNTRDINELLGKLINRVQAGTKLIISAMQLLYCECTVIAKMKPDVDPETVMDLIWDAYQEYFRDINPGDSVLINKVEYYIMLTNALDYIDDLRINGSTTKIPMNNQYTLAQEYSISIRLISSTNLIFEGSRGELEPLDYNPES